MLQTIFQASYFSDPTNLQVPPQNALLLYEPQTLQFLRGKNMFMNFGFSINAFSSYGFYKIIFFRGLEFLLLLGMEVREPIREIKNKEFIKKIREYLKFDSYDFFSLWYAATTLWIVLGTQ